MEGLRCQERPATERPIGVFFRKHVGGARSGKRNQKAKHPIVESILGCYQTPSASGANRHKKKRGGGDQ